jgi:AraC-like DNA-binding protein
MTWAAADSGPPAFSYAGVPRGRQYEAWREEFCRRFAQLDAEPTAAAHIECTVEVVRCGPLSLGAAQGSSGSFRRTRGLLTDGCDDLVLVTAALGDMLAVQRGRSVELRPSQMCLLSLGDVAETTLGEGGRFTALRIPRRDLLAACREGEDWLSKPLNGDRRLRDIVARYFDLCASAAASLDAVSQVTMARHMTELVALLLHAQRNGVAPDLRAGHAAARFQVVQAQVLEHLVDGDLSIGAVARRARLSPKQVQRLFERNGLTLSEFVLEQRLLLARGLLSGAGGRGKIASVAHDAGFGDLSYFNRTFRKRFGVTPSEWRAAQPTFS